MYFVDLAEVHTFGFIIIDFKTIFHGSFWYLVDALLHFSFYGGHIFGAVKNEEVIDMGGGDRLLFLKF